MALKKVKGTLERVLDKNLQDLVRGIRNHKENESKYIAECMDEIKQELKQENLAIKANAVNKLAYLQMLGYDISWAAFNIIEVMSSTKFTFKRVGYLAASQCFHDGTDVLMLTTNMIRKEFVNSDMSSVSMYDAGVALSGLACFITSDLARDLANDIMTLMTSSKPYLRKKAVLIMYKVFLQFPEALRPAFPRLKDKLEDPDPGVQSAAVNVICELARKNPKNYLSLAPLFFKLMTTSTNNWVLIKIIKLFGALTPLEPRLGKKLIEPLTNLIHSTSAMSLLYECINTVIAGIPNHSASIQLCVQKLRILIEDSDQNLKYLGLLAMSRILATHPKSVQGHKDLVLQCLDDKDESIRLRALDLLYGMVTKKNLMEIVKKLMVHMDKAEGSHYRDELLSKIIVICSQSNYQFVTNFEWYVSILVELTRMEGTRHGGLIAAQMLDVAIRVQAIRHFAVSQMAILLENSHLLANNSQRNGICEVLYAAAWICGEFSEHLKEPQQTLEAMLRPKLTSLPGHIQSVYVQNLLKLYCKVVRRLEDEEDQEGIQQVHTTLQEKLPIFVQSGDLEVQERACSMLALVKYVVKIREKGVTVGDELASLYAGELNPVATKAQRKVPVPEGLDLDAWINQPESDSSDEEETMGVGFFSSVGSEEHRSTYQLETSKQMAEPTPEELEKRREARRTEQEHNPHYLKDDGKNKKSRRGNNDVSGIPVAAIDLTVPLHVPGLSSSDKYMQLENQKSESRSRKEGKSRKKGKKKRRKGKESESEEDVEQVHAVSTVFDAPDGVEAASDKEDDGDKKDPYKMLDINLDAPLRDDETLPVRTHRIVGDEPKAEDEAAAVLPTEKHKKKHKKDKEKKEKKEKKSKKKKRSKSESHEENGPSLLLATGGEEPADDVVVNNTEDEPQENEVHQVDAEKGDDLDFWLTGNGSAAQKSADASANGESETVGELSAGGGGATSIPTITTTKVSAAEVVLTSEDEDHTPRDSDEKRKKKKEKKSKKDKERKEKKDKKKKSKEKRSEYIEAEGITTPSKENLPPSQQPTPMEVKLPPMSSYKLLADNASVKLTYEVRINHQRSNQVVVSIVFANLTSHTLKDLEFNVLDTLNSKLIRGLGQNHSDAVKVPFTLPPGAQNEGQFAFTVDDITAPQKLRGTLTYILKSPDGSTQEKVDFRIHLPCCSYLLTSPCKSEDFASLLSSGDLTAKASVRVEVEGAPFDHLLARLSFFTHFRVVEKVAESASLFSRSIQDHPVCLLVKMANGALAVDGKSTDDGFLANILEDVRTVCTETISAQS